MAAAVALLTVSVGSHAQAIIPIPFATTYAGVAAGGPNAYCGATNDIVNTAGQHLGDGCLPVNATLAASYGAFTDAAGNVYITENGTGSDNDIRVVYKGGTTLQQLLIASSPNIPNFMPVPGHIYTLAGSIAATFTNKNAGGKYGCGNSTSGASALDSAGDGCPGTLTYIRPRGLFVDGNGNVFFVSTGGGNTVKVLFAGGATVSALITAENPGVTPQLGYVYKLAGQSTASYNGNGAIASASALVVVRDVVVDPYSNVYISDGTSSTASGNSVRVIYGGVQAPAGIANPTLGFIYTYAGAAGCAAGSTTCAAGDTGDTQAATAALLNGPYTLFLDRFNNLFIAEYLGNRLRVVYAGVQPPPGMTGLTAGSIYTFTGSGTSTADGTPAAQVMFGSVQVGGVDPAGNIYVEDSTAKVIWKFDALTSVGSVIGGRYSGTTATAGMPCSAAVGSPNSTDNFGDGCPATQATLGDIGRISFDPQGNIYVGENGNAVVRRLTYNTQFPNVAVGSAATQPLAFKAITATTLTNENITEQGATTQEYADAGNGSCTASSVLILGQVCTFNVAFKPGHDGLRPGSFQLTAATTVGATTTNSTVTDFVSGVGLAAETAVDPSTQILAAQATPPSPGVQPVTTPNGIAVDLSGGVYVSDSKGNQVLKGGATSTLLSPLVTGLKSPGQIALDSLGNIYIADTGNNRVVEANAGGTILGTIGSGLSAPQGVTVDAFGNVFIADTGNNRVVQVAPNGVQTLSAASGLTGPTQLTFDSNGNLYIVDLGNNRLVEVPTNATQITVILGTGVHPTAVAADPSGTIYVTDSASLQLLSYAPQSTNGNTLLTALVTPIGLAVDLDGNLFLADSGSKSALYLRRVLGNITFPITNVNSTSTSPINLTNVGNASFNFPTTTLYTLTGSQQFSLAPATTNGCGSGVNYTPGAGCSLTATFAPTARGNSSANVTFNTTAANAAIASANLIGISQQLVATTTTVSVAPSATISYGQSITISATVTPSSNVGTPTGTVTFTVDNKAQAPLPYGNGTYSLTLTPGVGPHSVSVAFSGDANYASSSQTASYTVVQATTATTLTVTPVNIGGVISLQFVATVSSPTANNETGFVNFYAGAQLIAQQVTLSTTNHTATYTTSTLNYASNSFTAVYSGDTNFTGSTSAAVGPPPDFAIGIPASTLAIPQGGVGYLNYAVSSLYGGAATLTPSCSGLPANTVCRFTPNPIVLNGTVPVTLAIYTNVNASLSSLEKPFIPKTEYFALLLPGLLLIGFRSRKRAATLFAVAVLLCMIVGATGCGSTSAAQANAGLITPAGTSTVTISFAGAPLTTRSTTVQLMIIPNTTQF